MDIIYHYPPELLQLLIDTIPRLCRSKKDVILFFRGAGVPQSNYSDVNQQLNAAPDGVNKFQIARTVLTRLNERGETTLRERREVLKRVVEFEDFSTCWPNDQLCAKGLVSEVRRVVNVKDSFTRMDQERERERKQKASQHQQQVQRAKDRRDAFDKIKTDFYALFSHTNPQTRGTLCESIFNRLFAVDSLLVRESFRVTDDKTGDVLEQIDGAIEVTGDLYLAEMKWLKNPLDVNDVSRHLVRVYHRGYSRGIFISATPFTSAAIDICREALQKTVVLLITFDELTRLLENYDSVSDFIRKKVTAAITDKNPYLRLYS